MPTTDMPDHVRVAVLGGGSAAERLAGLLASGGVDVAVVERHLVGGECPYYACIPSKAMLLTAAARHAIGRAHDIGAAAAPLDAGDGAEAYRIAARRRDDAAANHDDRDHVRSLEDKGVHVIRGEGRVCGPGRLSIDTDDGPHELGFDELVLDGEDRVEAGRGIVEEHRDLAPPAGSGGWSGDLRFLERRGLANAAGAAAMRAPKQPKSLPKPLTAVDARRVVSAGEQLAEEPWIAARNAAVLTLLYGCGLRISEALGLTGADAPLPEVLRISGKGGKERIVPGLGAARDAVNPYLRLFAGPCDFVKGVVALDGLPGTRLVIVGAGPIGLAAGIDLPRNQRRAARNHRARHHREKARPPLFDQRAHPLRRAVRPVFAQAFFGELAQMFIG